jgi:hypothetical protein
MTHNLFVLALEHFRYNWSAWSLWSYVRLKRRFYSGLRHRVKAANPMMPTHNPQGKHPIILNTYDSVLG